MTSVSMNNRNMMLTQVHGEQFVEDVMKVTRFERNLCLGRQPVPVSDNIRITNKFRKRRNWKSTK